MKIAITGAAGFVGSNLVYALQNDNEILAIDKLRSNKRLENGNLESLGHYKNLLDFNGEFFVGDICDKATIKKIKDFKPDIIYHQAAISDTTIFDQNLIFNTNLNSFYDFIKLSIKLNAKLIYASSAAVYGNSPSPQSVGIEDPRNPYGMSKLLMDKLALKYKNEAHIIGLRYFNVYGKGEFYKEKTSSMILQFALQLLKGENPVLFDRSDQIFRDFVYIKDVINANLIAINSKSGVYNVGSSKARSFQDIVDVLQIELNTNMKCKYILNPYKDTYQFYTQAKLDKNFAYRPKFGLEDGIKDYLKDIKDYYIREINA